VYPVHGQELREGDQDPGRVLVDVARRLPVHAAA
jgi:hypothetical protein